MKWTQQRHLVESLSDRAQDSRREARRFRGNLREWTTRYLGSTEALVWLFVAGSFVAAGGPSAGKSNATGRSMLAAINTFLLGWQLVNRELKFARPRAADPIE